MKKAYLAALVLFIILVLALKSIAQVESSVKFWSPLYGHLECRSIEEGIAGSTLVNCTSDNLLFKDKVITIHNATNFVHIDK